MRVVATLTLFAAWSAAQDLPRFELKASAWRSSVQGQFQSGLLPIDLRSDLALANEWQFFGTAVVRVSGHHRIVIEGSPLQFTGRNELVRSIEYSGRVYSVRETVESEAQLTYLFVAHEWDFLLRRRGHLGLRTGIAYLDASGTLVSASTGISAARSYRVPLPLIGPAGRVFVYRRVVDVDGDFQGMSFGGYGRYVQGGGGVGVSFRGVGARVGYRIIDADVHERGPAGSDRIGVSPRISGLMFSIGWRTGE
jgi:hypothetical protein